LANLSFPSRAKLIKTDDFSSVFNFRKRISGRFLAIHYRQNHLAWPRLGLVVAKKIARLSVQRNYMKRVLRDLFRIRQQQLAPVDLVIRPHKLFKHTDYPAIQQEFSDLIAKIQCSPISDKKI
jgi:ribonuclease P protein component